LFHVTIWLLSGDLSEDIVKIYLHNFILNQISVRSYLVNHQADGRRPQVENCWLRVICTVSHGRLILRLNLQSVTGEKIFLIICFLQIKHVMMLIVFSPATWRCLQILTSVKPFSSFIRKKSMTGWISPTLTTVRIILADREFFSWMVNYVHSFWRIYVSGCSF